MDIELGLSNAGTTFTTSLFGIGYRPNDVPNIKVFEVGRPISRYPGATIRIVLDAANAPMPLGQVGTAIEPPFPA